MAEGNKTSEKKTRSSKRRFRTPKGKHLTPAQKKRICEIYRNGSATYRDLAKEYNCDPQTIARTVREAGVKKGENSDYVQKKIQEEVDKRLAEDAAMTAARIKETKDEVYKMNAGLAKLIWKVVIDSKKDTKNGGRITVSAANEIKALKAAAEGLRITRSERYAVLNVLEKEKEELENRQDFPELKIQELDAETIQKMNEAQRLQMEDIGEMWEGDDPDIAFDDRVEEGEDEDDLIEEGEEDFDEDGEND